MSLSIFLAGKEETKKALQSSFNISDFKVKEREFICCCSLEHSIIPAPIWQMIMSFLLICLSDSSYTEKYLNICWTLKHELWKISIRDFWWVCFVMWCLIWGYHTNLSIYYLFIYLRRSPGDAVVKVQHCRETLPTAWSSILMGLKVNSAFHPSEVRKMITQIVVSNMPTL